MWVLRNVSSVTDHKIIFKPMQATEYNIYVVHKMIGMEETESQPETCELVK